jgi:Tannase and feruloyl esterase
VFDPRTCDVLTVLRNLIGTVTPCGTFTATDALVVQEIWQGPRLSGSQNDLLHGAPVWFGMEPGAELAGPVIPSPFAGINGAGGVGLVATYQLPDGSWAGAPFIPSADWFQRWITQDPTWVYTDLTYQQYWQDFVKSGQMFNYALATDNPDLRAFQAAGGKLIMWQGLADQLIFTGDSINYYNQAVAANGGLDNTQSFFRYFLAPGVQHCGTPGPGSIAPTNPMQQVIDWVEEGQAPAVLNASGSINGQSVTRPLCPYPDPDATYSGGDPTVAANYTCTSRPQFTNPFLLNGQALIGLSGAPRARLRL